MDKTIDSSIVVEYINKNVSKHEDKLCIFNKLFETTNDSNFDIASSKLMINKYKLTNNNADKWLKLINILKENFKTANENEQFWYYQAKLIAILCLNYPFTTKDFGMIKICRSNDKHDDIDNAYHNYIVNENKMMIADSECNRFKIKCIDFDQKIGKKMMKWVTLHNKTNNFIISKKRKVPTNVGNFISSKIFRELDFPRFK